VEKEKRKQYTGGEKSQNDKTIVLNKPMIVRAGRSMVNEQDRRGKNTKKMGKGDNIRTCQKTSKKGGKKHATTEEGRKDTKI